MLNRPPLPASPTHSFLRLAKAFGLDQLLGRGPCRELYSRELQAGGEGAARVAGGQQQQRRQCTRRHVGPASADVSALRCPALAAALQCMRSCNRRHAAHRTVRLGKAPSMPHTAGRVPAAGPAHVSSGSSACILFTLPQASRAHTRDPRPSKRPWATPPPQECVLCCTLGCSPSSSCRRNSMAVTALQRRQ